MIDKILKKISFLRDLNEADIKKIARIARLKKYPAGTKIFSKDDIGGNFFVVKEGKIKIYTSIGKKNKTMAHISKNGFFGEMSLLGCGSRSASAETMENSELLVIHKNDFQKHLYKHPEFAIKMLYTMAERLSKADKEIEAMLFHNILGRLANAILEISAENGGAEEIRIDQNQIAEYIGTTRVPICRAVSTLKKSGIIDYSREKLTIKDARRLKSMAGK